MHLQKDLSRYRVSNQCSFIKMEVIWSDSEVGIPQFEAEVAEHFSELFLAIAQLALQLK